MVGLLRHLDDPTALDGELLHSINKDMCKLVPSSLTMGTTALNDLSNMPDTKGHHSDIISASVSSSESIFAADNIRTQDASRRNTYRQKQKAHKEALYMQVEELSSQLFALMEAKEAALVSIDMTQGTIWKALAIRNKQVRQNAEDQRAKLRAAVDRRARLIQDLGQLVQKRMHEEALEDLVYTAKRLRTETPNKALYEVYLKELDEIYAKTDSIIYATAKLADMKTCERSRLFYYPPQPFSSNSSCHELIGMFTTPYAYEKVRKNLYEMYCLEFRLGSLSHDAAITKYRVESLMGSAIQHCVKRQYNECNRIVIVWRKFTEGEGNFGGMHSDETGWCVVGPSKRNGTLSSVVQFVSRFVPIHLSVASASTNLMKQFADLLVKSNEEICQLGLQTLENEILDDAERSN
ncbi:hypothetical protein Plhal304r1_c018g0065741 [Plasmopara halstedii]